MGSTDKAPPDPSRASNESRTLAEDSKTLADSPAAVRAPQGGVNIPDHELLSCIGRGSYGEVWLARNVMGTYRAVKIVYRAAFEHARPLSASSMAFRSLNRSRGRTTGLWMCCRSDAGRNTSVM